MAVFFTGKELIEIAIGIEKNGAAYYETLVDCAQSTNIKAVYKELAEIERDHIVLFQEMLGSVADYQPPETYTDEYRAYFEALVDSLIFTDEKFACSLAKDMSSDEEAIQTALRVEKDSILFYTEMRDLVRHSDRDVVNEIIMKKKSHVIKLAELQDSIL
jgi:rubrerythrin